MHKQENNTITEKQFSNPLVNVASRLELLYQLRDNNRLDKSQMYLIPLLETAFFTDVSIAEIRTYDEAAMHKKTNCELNVCFCFCEIAVREGVNHLCGWDKVEQNQQTKIGKLNAVLPDKKWKKEIIEKGNAFIQYCKTNNLFLNLVGQSNISKHYDTDFMRVLQHLRLAGDETNRKRVDSYIRLLIDIKDYIQRYIDDNQIAIIKDPNLALIPKQLNGVVIQHFKDYNIIQSIIADDESFFCDVDFMGGLQRKIACVYKKDALKETPKGKLYAESRVMAELFAPIYHIRYVELGICYAIKAYEECSEGLMKQFNLYRIVMAYYEGFRKLFGLSEKEEQPSLLQILHDYCENADNTIKLKEAEVKFSLQSIVPNVKSYGEYRHIATHNRDGRKDKVLEKFSMIVQMDPTKLFKDVWLFLEIRRPLYELTDMLAEKYLPEYWPKR